MNTTASPISPVTLDAGDATIANYGAWVSLSIHGQPTETVHGTVNEAIVALNRYRREQVAA